MPCSMSPDRWWWMAWFTAALIFQMSGAKILLCENEDESVDWFVPFNGMVYL
jgi:hypothetical protein